MAIIREYTPHDQAAVAAFNHRLAAAGSTFAFRPRGPTTGDRWSAYVAVDGDAVRGGYLAVQHRFVVGSDELDVHHLKLPLSEGSVDPAHNAVGVQLLVDAQRRFPLLFALGMGGRQNPLPRMLESLGWKLEDARFFFRVSRPQRFLRQVTFLRTTRARRAILDGLAVTGLGLAILPVHGMLDRLMWARGASSETVAAFGNWADRVWERGRPAFGLVALRDRARLVELYGGRSFLRLRVDRGGETIGWAVLLDTQLEGHEQFGDMRLGSLVDGFAIPGEEKLVVREATRVLRKRGVDLIVTNQSAPRWCAAMLENGWLEGPSSYTLGLSRRLATRVGTGALHVTRGDGDGPISL